MNLMIDNYFKHSIDFCSIVRTLACDVVRLAYLAARERLEIEIKVRKYKTPA
jgi:hypothetical protein